MSCCNTRGNATPCLMQIGNSKSSCNADQHSCLWDRGTWSSSRRGLQDWSRKTRCVDHAFGYIMGVALNCCMRVHLLIIQELEIEKSVLAQQLALGPTSMGAETSDSLVPFDAA